VPPEFPLCPRGTCILAFALALSACGGGASSSVNRDDSRPVLGTSGTGASGSDRGLRAPLPGAPPFDASLVRKLEAAVAAKGPGYRPRTRHTNRDGSAVYTNRLILETSPYLIQHAHNPVNWYPWGDEAFETAAKLKRPVLLSVGYSTCHWCHVMEEESFEDEEIARVMNEKYVAIKVDREERPDVDGVYMSAVQTLTGGGGWPMNVWLTPDRKPFFGGTYFPARDGDRGARVGFLTLLLRMRESYDLPQDELTSRASTLVKSIQEDLSPAGGADLPGAAVLGDAAKIYQESFDPTYGGTNRAPKFPSSLPIRFLLRYHRHAGDTQSLKMATLTLEKMASGGICDQVGGGFHRYSTDSRWLVPHFEKMLYDNALLVSAYLEGYQATGREGFAQVAREILRYVERDMTSPEGAFYAATDADSPGPDGRREEGWFFTWTPAEIETVVGPERAKVVLATYAVTAQGNFAGRTILSRPAPPGEVARALNTPAGRIEKVLEESRELLYAARAKRQPPLRDEKILTAWNGLMISALSQAALALGDEKYSRQAVRAADFILKNLRRNGRLLRSYTGGRSRHDAYLGDYAFLTAGLLDLYEATGDPRRLQQALDLDAILEKHYEDLQAGGFFLTADDHERLLAREKPSYDAAEPSGNSVAVLNLLRLHEYTTEDRFRIRAERSLKAFDGLLTRTPAALSEMLLAVDFHLDTPKEVVIIAPHSRTEAADFLAQLRAAYVPNRVLVVASEGADLEAQKRLVPFLDGKVAQKGKATAYVCEKGVCLLPTTDPQVFARQIRKVAPLPATPRAG